MVYVHRFEVWRCEQCGKQFYKPESEEKNIICCPYCVCKEIVSLGVSLFYDKEEVDVEVYSAIEEEK